MWRDRREDTVDRVFLIGAPTCMHRESRLQAPAAPSIIPAGGARTVTKSRLAAIPIVLLSLLLPTGAAAADPDVLQTLRRDRPRLMVPAERFAEIPRLVARDPQALAYWRHVRSESDKLLTKPPLTRQMQGKRLLATSREALRRISFLAARHRIEPDERIRRRAADELLAVCAFADWNPSHFLDVAEMTTAVAIGYDWLFDSLGADERAVLRAAILEKGLRPGLDAYAKKLWWTDVSHNWAQVTAGGLAIGALAIADDEPEVARQILQITREKMIAPMKTFAPDGGCGEGPGYWNYATQYNVYYLAAIESALGTDFGFAAYPGLDRTGDFRMQTISPAGKVFNFADGAEGPSPASQMFWLARRFDRPDYAAHEKQLFPRWGDVFHLLWYVPSPPLATRPPPSDALFRGVEVASFRSEWGKPIATFVSVKGGDNATNHAHLDLGTFVLDALGERFILDPGADSYDIPNYFGANRWTFFRTRTEGHNTPLIDRQNQGTTSAAPIVAHRSTPDRAVAVIDLGGGYPNRVRSLRRGVALLERAWVLVQDEVEADDPVEFSPLLQTAATVTRADDGRSVRLVRNGQSLRVTLHEPAGATIEVEPITLPPPQRSIENHHRLRVVLPGKTRSARVVMSFSPGDRPVTPAVEPLDRWIGWAHGPAEPR
jgi:hypothetical protein